MIFAIMRSIICDIIYYNGHLFGPQFSRTSRTSYSYGIHLDSVADYADVNKKFYGCEDS